MTSFVVFDILMTLSTELPYTVTSYDVSIEYITKQLSDKGFAKSFTSSKIFLHL